MATMEQFRTRLARARAESVQSGRVVLGVPAMMGAARTGCYFLLASVLAGGVIMGSSAPFGVALVGGAGSGVYALAALLGACMGYVALLGLVEGLRYVAAAILTFSVAFAFCDTKLYRKVWTMPVAAAIMSGCAGFIYLSQLGWRTRDVIWFTLELVLTALFTYAFRAALAQPEQLDLGARRLGGVLLLTAVLISLSQLTLFADIGLGRILAGMAVLVSACQMGLGSGAITGVLLGLAMDLSSGQAPLYVMCFGAAGLVAGLYASRRIRGAICFVLTGAAVVLWLWDGGLRMGALCEVFAAGLLFVLVPTKVWDRVGALFPREEAGQMQDTLRAYVGGRLSQAAQAFQTLHETMRTAFRRPPANDNDTATVFRRAADRVCRTCTLRDTCWRQNYITTCNALNDATGAMLRRGSARAEDFPAHFSGRCVHMQAFLAAVNEELTGLLCRRQYASRIRDSRRTVCQQYGQLSHLLTEAAQELGQSLTTDPARQRRLRQHLSLMGFEGDGAVFYDRSQHLRVRISGPAANKLTGAREVAILSDLMGMPLYLLEQEDGALTLAQSEPFMVVAGIAARKKNGETVSGDAGTWFKQEDGRVYMLLCDGMGSGVGANRESGLAVRLLEQFLKAGVEAEHVLTILNGALSLRSEEDGGFTTVDLLQLDLFTGQTAVWKFGAAPTYIRTATGVRRVSTNSMPAGVDQRGGRPDCTRMTLAQGDWVLMVSDGICPDGEDGALRTLLTNFKGDSPKELARLVLELPGQPVGDDDCTVLAVRLVQRPRMDKSERFDLTKTDGL